MLHEPLEVYVFKVDMLTGRQKQEEPMKRRGFLGLLNETSGVSLRYLREHQVAGDIPVARIDVLYGSDT